MTWTERSYNAKLYRPRPECYIDESGQIILISTPWGPRSLAKRVNQTILDHLIANQGDQEATSPFEQLTCLSSAANHLRNAILLTNETIYREENKSEYQGGVEVTALVRNGREWTLGCIGQPFVFHSRPGRPLIPLNIGRDISEDFSFDNQILSPLPGDLLGINPSLQIYLRSFSPQADDQVVFLSRTEISPGFLGQNSADRSLESFSKRLVDANEKMPFWLGIFRHEPSEEHKG